MVVCVVQESTFHQTPEGIFLLYYLKRSQSSGKQFPLITPLTSGNILDFPIFINKNFSLISLFELVSKFYVYSSVHLWSILIIVQRDVTQIRLFIILQVHSTCFGCQPHPSSGVHKTGTKGSGTGHIFVQLPPSNVTKQVWPRWREPHPSSSWWWVWLTPETCRSELAE